MFTRNLFGPKDFPLVASLAVHRLGIDLHSHDSVELALVTRGKATHRLQAESFPIEMGDVFVIPPLMLHGYENCRDFQVMNIAFDSTRLLLPDAELARLPGFRALFNLEPQARQRHGFKSRLTLPAEDLQRLLTTIHTMQRELKARQPGFDVAATGLFSAVLVDLARQYTRMTSPASQSLVRLSAVVEWLTVHFAQPICLTDIARRAHMSESSIRRAFHECFGLSPMNYLIELRLSRAEYLLQHSDASIREVALKVGIDDPSYFARLFRKRTGLEPSAYRARQASRNAPVAPRELP
ncbi:MAG: AraC family transcriptional regulator [Polyangiaceae bacterium]|nr:AraC family transcriptional regulator [Polyangiaceae bacterium]